MPILDLQKRSRELGRIRIGQVVPTADGKRTRPDKLDRFRLTSHSKALLDRVAELYGGTVNEWQPQGGGAQAWEVITTSSRLPIMVPPQPVTQWFEYWTAGGCQHRCDGRTNVLNDELCDPEDFKHTEALKKPTTRLNVVLRDVEGIGVWRLETHGWNAAVELPDAAEFLAQAGGYVEGWVSLEPRTSKAEVPDRQNGGTKIETRHFMVPIIEIDVTPSELMAGRGRVQAPQLEGPAQTPALGGGAAPDLYLPFFEQLEAATSYDAVQAVWVAALEAKLVGPESVESARRAEFFQAIKAKGAAVQPAPAGPPATAGGADAGVVDAELVPDADADAVWAEIIKTAGSLPNPMGLSEVADDFKARMGGLLPDDASAGELQAYLAILNQEPAGVPA